MVGAKQTNNKGPKGINGTAAVHFHPGRVSFAYRKRPDPGIHIATSATTSVSEAERLLASWADGAGLFNASCDLVLDASDYQLLRVRRPAVAEVEVAQALRWQIRERLSFPVDEAVIDYFEAPPAGTEKQGEFVFAVVARRSSLARYVTAVGNAGMQCRRIDVASLALARLQTALNKSLEPHTALLTVLESRYALNLVSHENFYFERDLSFAQTQSDTGTSGSDSPASDQIVRSVTEALVYSNSMFSDVGNKQVKVVNVRGDVESLDTILSTQSGLQAEIVDLANYLPITIAHSETNSGHACVAIGGLLPMVGL